MRHLKGVMTEMDEPNSAALSSFLFIAVFNYLLCPWASSQHGVLFFMKGEYAFDIVRCDWMRKGVDWTHGLASFYPLLVSLCVALLDTSWATFFYLFLLGWRSVMVHFTKRPEWTTNEEGIPSLFFFLFVLSLFIPSTPIFVSSLLLHSRLFFHWHFPHPYTSCLLILPSTHT